jgi:hypothetical protein
MSVGRDVLGSRCHCRRGRYNKSSRGTPMRVAAQAKECPRRQQGDDGVIGSRTGTPIRHSDLCGLSSLLLF